MPWLTSETKKSNITIFNIFFQIHEFLQILNPQVINSQSAKYMSIDATCYTDDVL